ncbi:MAG TPA: NifU family protein [Egibacteraceae bacterium]|jgi:Fe-S cluster biogenesis protein NfuA|nr:NifU family protein [Egibacteraceae bacterium]
MEREELGYDEMLDRIAQLVDSVDQSDSELREPALELLDYLEAWHREGLTRLVTAIPPQALDSARQDPVVAHLLDTYLGEDDQGDAMELVQEALEEIRPYVHSHGGEMELIGIEGGVVTLELMGACDGCPSSMVTLTQGVEQILRDRWPDFRALKVAGDDQPVQQQPQQLLQIQSLKRS